MKDHTHRKEHFPPENEINVKATDCKIQTMRGGERGEGEIRVGIQLRRGKQARKETKGKFDFSVSVSVEIDSYCHPKSSALSHSASHAVILTDQQRVLAKISCVHQLLHLFKRARSTFASA